jgi:serine/threonine protein kinase
MGDAHPARFVRFGPFQLDLRAGELLRDGVRVRVPEQSIRVLALLVESPGEVVTRQELHEKLWPNGTIVEFDHGINAVIKRLRQALGDSADAPTFIETLPRRGYRLRVPVERALSPDLIRSSEPEPGSDELTGQTISHYRILGKLGQGAMGVVYQAEDTNLGRSVAVKFLPEELSDDPRALERFEREARAASALNHPNICTVYEVDQHEGVRFIAMEYVAGKSLDQLVGPEGLPVKDVLSYAIQIADALAKAHSVGIVHRDLKPSNIMVSQDGLVKLLDFGLAKVRAGQPAIELTAPPAENPLTGEGAILGTLQYMAPEQLEGREADTRTDIFAFGAVIYEMATGRKAFEGKSQASLIAAILEREPPPVSIVVPLAPPALDRVVATCLAKNPDNRWQTARYLQHELKWVADTREQPPALPVKWPNSQLLSWALVAILSLAVVVLATVRFREKPVETNAVRFQVPLPADVGAWESVPVVSPNGEWVVFSRVGPDRPHFWLHSLNSMTTRSLAETDGAYTPFWSPDSRFVAFYVLEKSKTDGHYLIYLKKIDVMSGQSQMICKVGDQRGESTWSRDGVILLSQSGGPSVANTLYRVSASGSELKPVLQLDKSRQERSQNDPQFLPDGRHFIYRSVWGSESAEKNAIYLGSLDSNETRLLTSVTSNVSYAAPGFLIYGREESLFAQQFDLKKLRLTGEPFPVAEHVAHSPDQTLSFFSTSENGVLVYRSAASGNMRLAWYRRDGTRLGSIGEPGRYEDLAMSPDETRLAAHRRDLTFTIWTVELSSGIFTRLTFREPHQINPVWSPDGRELVFSSPQKAGGEFDLYRKVVGGAQEELLFESSESKVPQQWLRDGSVLFQTGLGSQSGTVFYRLPLSGPRKPTLVLKTESSKTSPHVCSDGRWVAYQSDETGQNEVYVGAFPTFMEKRRVSSSGGCQALWRKDGKELFYLGLDGKVMSVDVRTGRRLETDVPKVLFQAPGRVEPGWDQYCVTGDGKKFIFLEPVEASKSLTVVLNWTAGLKR